MGSRLGATKRARRKYYSDEDSELNTPLSWYDRQFSAPRKSSSGRSGGAAAAAAALPIDEQDHIPDVAGLLTPGPVVADVDLLSGHEEEGHPPSQATVILSGQRQQLTPAPDLLLEDQEDRMLWNIVDRYERDQRIVERVNRQAAEWNAMQRPRVPRRVELNAKRNRALAIQRRRAKQLAGLLVDPSVAGQAAAPGGPSLLWPAATAAEPERNDEPYSGDEYVHPGTPDSGQSGDA